LTQFKRELEKRNSEETNIRYEWYALQRWGAEYWQDFAKPKILYQEIATYQAFAWDVSGAYCNNKTFFIPDASKYLLALLNARTTWFFLDNTASKLQGNAFALQTPYVTQVPVPIDETAQAAIEELVNHILAAKAKDPAADVSAWEAEIDRLVYALYGLTDEEIAVVEVSRPL
jgi:hypothetical protein